MHLYIKCVFLTVGKLSLWYVKGSDSERDNECNFEKPAAKKKEKPVREMLSKTAAKTRKSC